MWVTTPQGPTFLRRHTLTCVNTPLLHFNHHNARGLPAGQLRSPRTQQLASSGNHQRLSCESHLASSTKKKPTSQAPETSRRMDGVVLFIRSNVCLSRRAICCHICCTYLLLYGGTQDSGFQHRAAQLRAGVRHLLRYLHLQNLKKHRPHDHHFPPQTGIEALHRKNFFPNCSSLVQFVRNNSDNSHFLAQSTTYLGMCTNFLRQRQLSIVFETHSD